MHAQHAFFPQFLCSINNCSYIWKNIYIYIINFYQNIYFLPSCTLLFFSSDEIINLFTNHTTPHPPPHPQNIYWSLPYNIYYLFVNIVHCVNLWPAASGFLIRYYIVILLLKLWFIWRDMDSSLVYISSVNADGTVMIPDP